MRSPAKILVTMLLALTLVAAAACGKSPEDLGIPIYEPSDTVSEATGSTVLETGDSVERVSTLYADFIDEEDWETVSEASSSAAANFTIKKSGDGATISISTSGSGSLISISTYPSP